MILVAHYQSPKVLQPGKPPLHLPPSSVATQRPPILGRLCLSVAPMRRSHLYPTLCQLFIKWVAVVGAIPDQSLRLLLCKPRIESRFDKGDLMWASRRCVHGERKTRAVCHCHELRTLAPLGFSNICAPFFAATKVPSMKHSLKSSSPRALRSTARASNTRRSTPSLTHCWN